LSVKLLGSADTGRYMKEKYETKINLQIHARRNAKTKAWKNIKQSIKDLEENQDISLTEWHEYIVGYICQQLDKDDLIKNNSIKTIK
jgi:hypothetical protein